MNKEGLPSDLFESLLNQVDTGVLLLDGDDTIVYWNRFMASHSQVGVGKVVGSNLFDVFPDLPRSLLRRKLTLVRNLRAPAFTGWRERRHIFPLADSRTFIGGDGRMAHNLSFLPVSDDQGSCRFVCILVYDTSEVAVREGELQDLNEELQRISSTDVLTGLRNRRDINQCLEIAESEARRYDRKFSLALLDVDHFKQINDTYGHAGGDEVLRYMGRTLRDCLRTPDVPARFGGEEFLIFLPNSDSAAAHLVGDRIRARIEADQVDSGQELLQFTVSIGTAEWSNTLKDFDALIGMADAALYYAKENGRNRVVAYESIPEAG